METGLCGADCSACAGRADCRGCRSTCGKPLGGTCLAAEYIKTGGKENYGAFRETLLAEINGILRQEGLPQASGLCELAGRDVNLAYRLPSGECVRFLNDRNIYLGTQIPFADIGVCYGVVAGTDFILVCSYGVDGSLPELIAYHRR